MLTSWGATLIKDAFDFSNYQNNQSQQIEYPNIAMSERPEGESNVVVGIWRWRGGGNQKKMAGINPLIRIGRCGVNPIYDKWSRAKPDIYTFGDVSKQFLQPESDQSALFLDSFLLHWALNRIRVIWDVAPQNAITIRSL